MLCDILNESYLFWTEVSEVGIDKEAIYSTYSSRIKKSYTDINFFKEINYFLKEFNVYCHLSVLDGYLYRLYNDTFITGNVLLTDQEVEKVQPIIEVLTDPIRQNTYSLLDQSHSGFGLLLGSVMGAIFTSIIKELKRVCFSGYRLELEWVCL